jgi:hypothetical protein
MHFSMFAPYIADQYLAESERKTRRHVRMFAGRTTSSRRRKRVT